MHLWKNCQKMKSYKKINKWLLIGLLLLLIALVVMAVVKGKSKPKGEPVNIEKVERRTISETVSACGRVFPETEVKISNTIVIRHIPCFAKKLLISCSCTKPENIRRGNTS